MTLVNFEREKTIKPKMTVNENDIYGHLENTKEKVM